MVAQLNWQYIKNRPWKIVPRLTSYLLFEGRPVTTRGRCVNGFVMAWLEGMSKRRPVDANHSPIFIVGLGRSGTTILGNILSMHRDVGYLNEPKAIWYYLNPQDDLVGNFGNKKQGSYCMTAEQANETIQQKARSIHSSYLRLSRSKRVVDKYPEMIYRIGYLRAIFPNARYIFLIRNGWDVCQSIGQWSARNHTDHGTQGHADWWGVEDRKWRLLVKQVAIRDTQLEPYEPQLIELTNQRQRAAVEWLLAMREGQCEIDQSQSQILTLRYEYLASEPRETLRKILHFCELPDDPVCEGYAVSIMRPNPPKPLFALPDYIDRPFRETMQFHGYPS